MLGCRLIVTLGIALVIFSIELVGTALATGTINVIEARFYADDFYGSTDAEFSQIFQSRCDGKDYCDVLCSNGSLTDTAVGHKKQCYIKYACAGVSYEVSRFVSPNAYPALLDCRNKPLQQAGTIDVIDLRYYSNRVHPTCRLCNWTRKLKTSCDGKYVCDVGCSNEAYTDSDHGVEKQCYIRYTCGGASYEVKKREASGVYRALLDCRNK